jgi:hypothetical protein
MFNPGLPRRLSSSGFTLNIAGRQEIEEALRKGAGGIWLDLTPEQYAKLKSGQRQRNAE